MCASTALRDVVATPGHTFLEVSNVNGDDGYVSLGADCMRAVDLAGRIEGEPRISFPQEVLLLDRAFASVVEACTAQKAAL